MNYPGLDKTTFMCPLPDGQDLYKISPTHKRPKWFEDRRVENRFDDRVWFLEDLLPGTQVHDLGFWALAKAGKEFVERLFLEKLGNDRWESEEG